MASRDAYASINAVGREVEGFDVAEVPPGSTIASKDAYASSMLGVPDVTEVPCLSVRTRRGSVCEET